MAMASCLIFLLPALHLIPNTGQRKVQSLSVPCLINSKSHRTLHEPSLLFSSHVCST
jgi:hypothetical protein